MTFLVERLAELRRHVEHLRELRPRISGPADLRTDLSLHNDVLFSLVTVCQIVVDIAGELSGRRGLAFADYTEAVQNLSHYEEVDERLVEQLEPLPGFRDVVIHEYATLDLDRVIEAMDRLGAVDQLIEVVGKIESEQA